MNEIFEMALKDGATHVCVFAFSRNNHGDRGYTSYNFLKEDSFENWTNVAMYYDTEVYSAIPHRNFSSSLGNTGHYGPIVEIKNY